MEKYKELIKQYLTYILSIIIIILLIIIGFLYSNTTTKKIEKEYKKPKVEEKPIIKSIYVDIKGEINNPGVYSLGENERVIDVINKAGGLTKEANTDYLNLSKKVTDEMVIIIYSKKEIKEFEKKKEEVKEIIKYEVIESDKKCPNITNNACINETDKTEKEETNDSKTNKLVNLNTATLEELLTLSGIGESKAKAIIEYRSENKFNSIEDIKNIKGIGDSLFEKIKDSITV